MTSPISGEGWSYVYDELGHLTTATHLHNPAESQSFSYDGADRILTSSRYGAYAYPSASQPRPHAPLSVNGTALSYDLNGNVTQAGTRSLVWNADDRPVQVTLGGVTTSFSYDGAGERLKKSSSFGASLYPFGDDYEITNGVVTKYISVDGLGVIAKRVGYGSSAVNYFLHTDRLGSIQAVTSDGSDPQYPAGTVVSRRSFRPFGETLAQSGPHAESRGWIDQRNDPETGLTYLHARYFDAQLGVFLSPDPISIDGGLNQYALGFGDPANMTDRTGLAGFWANCGDGSGDSCWYEIGGVDTVIEVTTGGSGAGSQSLFSFLDRLAPALILALPVPATGNGGTGDQGTATGSSQDTSQGNGNQDNMNNTSGSTNSGASTGGTLGTAPADPRKYDAIGPKAQADWNRALRALGSELLAKGLEEWASRQPCGSGKQAAYQVAAGFHAFSGVQLTALALTIGTQAVATAGPTGGASLFELGLAGVTAAAAGQSYSNMGDAWAAGSAGSCR